MAISYTPEIYSFLCTFIFYNQKSWWKKVYIHFICQLKSFLYILKRFVASISESRIKSFWELMRRQPWWKLKHMNVFVWMWQSGQRRELRLLWMLTDVYTLSSYSQSLLNFVLEWGWMADYSTNSLRWEFGWQAIWPIITPILSTILSDKQTRQSY